MIHLFNTIKLRFTLWYLTILAMVLICLGSGIYLWLAARLYRNLDRTLKARAEQIAQFRHIMAIVNDGAFEEEPGERISFFFYANGRLADISQKGKAVHIDPAWIAQIIAGESDFVTKNSAETGPLRIYGMPFAPPVDRPAIGRYPEAKPPPPRLPPGQEGHRRPPRHPMPGNRLGLARPRPPRPLPMPVEKSALIVARPSREIAQVMRWLLQILLMALPLTLVLAGGGGIFLLGRALKPVDLITRTAREIEEKDLSRRITVQTQDELGRLATTLNRMIARLETAFQRQKQLTGDASHELRAPLAVIQAEATLALERERDPWAYRKSLAKIAQQADHMAGVIKQLLMLARADSGQMRVVREPIDLAEFLQSFCEDADILCRHKHQALQLTRNASPRIAADAKLLRNLILNLLTNAIRYTDAGGRISISLAQEGAMAVIQVADTGIGIPADSLPHIFERFYRVDKARARRSGGSGLGLAICRQIVLAHHGAISVQSQISKGTTVTIQLPRLNRKRTA